MKSESRQATINGESLMLTVYHYPCESQAELIRVRVLLEALHFVPAGIGSWWKNNGDGTATEVGLAAGWAEAK